MLTKQDILELVEKEDVRFIRLQFTDMEGRMRNMAITTSKLSDAMDNRCKFDGCAVKGFASVANSDLYLYPDLDTFTIFPWRPHQGKVARLICDIYTPAGESVVYDSRMILKRELAKIREKGLTFNVGPEMEFFLFNTDDSGNPTLNPNDEAGYFDLAPQDNGENCRRDICLTLEEMGYTVESSHHEMAPGQHEVVFRYDDALTAADKIVTFKTVVKTLAKRNGLHATFMPKPFQDKWGSGMHLSMSLCKNDENLFCDRNDPTKLSDTAYKFIAGLLKYTPDMACLTNPIVNSYKRFTPGFEAPCYISWSYSNRSLLVRVPSVTRPEEMMVEFRAPDPAANPYLAIAACLKAGMAGIENSIALPPSIDINIYELSKREREALGVKNLPISLNEALKTAHDSQFITELLGKEFKRKYLDIKEKEYAEYAHNISKWEIDNYLIQY